ncbi:MAG TPA: permease-like cell division protein FtsX [Rhodocyclaceae bacterium]|jgi:cell division transport system permease protein|nr:permease-like cell division protein FtsX [Rhodocyclaceae bacterium]
MNVWLSHHFTALSLALRRLTSAPVNTLLSLLAMGIALALPAGGQMLFANAQQLANRSAPAARISLYLPVEAERKAATDLETKFKAMPGVKSWQFMSKEDTLARMKKAEGLGDVIDALPKNPFPDAYVLTPKDESPEAVEALAAQLRKLPRVEHVQLDSAWVRRLDALLRLGRSSLFILAGLLGVGLIAITFNTIRLQVLTLRAEIEVSRLLGATDAFIRRPFYWFGALQGLGGGIVAWFIVALATLGLAKPIGEIAQLYSLGFALQPLSLGNSLILLGAATVLGWGGAALSLVQHLKET